MKNVIVIGGGASGMMAAFSAAKAGHKVTLLEKNEKLGKKIYITGKGRCNLTNKADLETIFNNIVTNNKFMYSSLYCFTNEDVIDFFNNYGMETKVERGERVFPVSDKSSDVISTLERAIKDAGVKVMLRSNVKSILSENSVVTGVRLENGSVFRADAVIVATGGYSYQSTGSTGDGYEFAREFGHEVVTPRPALVPLISNDEFVKELQGLSLKNVNGRFLSGKKVLYEEFGEMLFTHFGVSGPIVLSASSKIFKKQCSDIVMDIDLKPALSKEQLDQRILRDFDEEKNKQFKNSLDKLLPKKMIPVIVSLSGINPEKKVNEITRQERDSLISLIKSFKINIAATRGFNEAIITAGGVKVKEIDPSTMQSKIINGLYFCGEVLDVDAFTGGFNLQIAWSSGYLAGQSIE